MSNPCRSEFKLNEGDSGRLALGKHSKSPVAQRALKSVWEFARKYATNGEQTMFDLARRATANAAARHMPGKGTVPRVLSRVQL